MARVLRGFVWAVALADIFLAIWFYSQRTPPVPEIEKGVLLLPLPEDPSAQKELLALQAEAGRRYLKFAERQRAAGRAAVVLFLLSGAVLLAAGLSIRQGKRALEGRTPSLPGTEQRGRSQSQLADR